MYRAKMNRPHTGFGIMMVLLGLIVIVVSARRDHGPAFLPYVSPLTALTISGEATPTEAAIATHAAPPQTALAAAAETTDGDASFRRELHSFRFPPQRSAQDWPCPRSLVVRSLPGRPLARSADTICARIVGIVELRL